MRPTTRHQVGQRFCWHLYKWCFSVQYRARQKKRFPGCEDFVLAVAYHFCLALPEKFSQPGKHSLARPCTYRVFSKSYNEQKDNTPDSFTKLVSKSSVRPQFWPFLWQIHCNDYRTLPSEQATLHHPNQCRQWAHVMRLAKRIVRSCKKFLLVLAWLFCLALSGCCITKYLHTF